MCGIYGYINKNKPINQALFMESLNKLEKRGPDSVGSYFEEKLGLGHRRLAIIDLSKDGNQPMFSDDKNLVIVFNGEIYNYKEIKNKLGDKYKWNSKSDTEVVINAYSEWGYENFLKNIEGMFAFGLYDKKAQVITFARDHFGKKPLYYYLDDEIFCFASELKAIINNPEIKSKIEIDKLSLSKFMFYGYTPSPKTIFNKIKKLEPSNSFQFDIKDWKLKNSNRYWNLENIEIKNNLDEPEILKHTEDLLRKSVEKRLMSDVPLGLFLSGGVDSSLIAYYMSKYGNNVGAYTVSYNSYKEADETNYAKKVASKLEMKLDSCLLEDRLVKENFIEIMDYLDEPLADAAITPLYFLSKKSKEKMTVVLSGDGGDEVFGGYEKYKAQAFIEKNKYLSNLAHLVGTFLPRGSKYFKLFKLYGENFEKRQFMFGSGSPLVREVSEALGKDIDTDVLFEEAAFYNNLFKENDTVNRSMYLDCKIQLPDWYLVKGDRATMANSQEMRCPFLDKDLVEFMFSLKGNDKTKGGESKYLLKKLASRQFDKDIIYRSKRGFGVPLDKWIRFELKELFEKYLFVDSHVFDKNVIESYFQTHLSGKEDNRFILLRIFCFNYWYENWFKRI